MTKLSMIRLSDKTGEEVKKYAHEKGLAFATAVRCIVVEHLKEIPVHPSAKMNVQAATNQAVTQGEGYE